jgi:hypothetical protein
VQEIWDEELKKRTTSTHPENHGPMADVVTRDEQDRRTTFAVHEGWTYELIEKDWQYPPKSSESAQKKTGGFS